MEYVITITTVPPCQWLSHKKCVYRSTWVRQCLQPFELGMMTMSICTCSNLCEGNRNVSGNLSSLTFETIPGPCFAIFFYWRPNVMLSYHFDGQFYSRMWELVYAVKQSPSKYSSGTYVLLGSWCGHITWHWHVGFWNLHKLKLQWWRYIFCKCF